MSAPELETTVFQALGIDVAAEITTVSTDLGESASPAPSPAEQLGSRAERIVLHPDRIEIIPKHHEGEVPRAPTIVPWTAKASRPCRAIIAPTGTATARPIRAETRARLLDRIANARVWLDEFATGRMADTKALAAREGCSGRHIRMTLNLAFLSPTIVKAAIEGMLPDGAGGGAHDGASRAAQLTRVVIS